MFLNPFLSGGCRSVLSNVGGISFFAHTKITKAKLYGLLMTSIIFDMARINWIVSFNIP